MPVVSSFAIGAICDVFSAIIPRYGVAAIGRAIYHEKIRDTLAPAFRGQIAAIDVHRHSGDYEIADKGIDATVGLLTRQPDAFI